MSAGNLANPFNSLRNTSYWDRGQRYGYAPSVALATQRPPGAGGGAAPQMPSEGAGGLIQGAAPSGDHYNPAVAQAASDLDAYKQRFGRTWMQTNARGGPAPTPNPEQGPTPSGAPVSNGLPLAPTGALRMTNAAGQTVTASGPKATGPEGGYGDQISAAMEADPQYQKLKAAHAAAVDAHVNGLNSQQYGANAATVTGMQNSADAIKTDAGSRQLAAQGQNARDVGEGSLATAQGNRLNVLAPSEAKNLDSEASARTQQSQNETEKWKADQPFRAGVNQNQVDQGKANVEATRQGIDEAKYLLPFRGQAMSNMASDPYVRDSKSGQVQKGTDNAPLLKPGWKMDDKGNPVQAGGAAEKKTATPGIPLADESAPYLWKGDEKGGWATDKQTGHREHYIPDPSGGYGLVSEKTGIPINMSAGGGSQPPQVQMPTEAFSPPDQRGYVQKSWDAILGGVGRAVLRGNGAPPAPSAAAPAAPPRPQLVDGQTAVINGRAMIRKNGQWVEAGLSDLAKR